MVYRNGPRKTRLRWREGNGNVKPLTRGKGEEGKVPSPAIGEIKAENKSKEKTGWLSIRD